MPDAHYEGLPGFGQPRFLRQELYDTSNTRLFAFSRVFRLK